MSLRNVWGWNLPQTSSYIHIRHTKCLSYWYAVSWAIGCTLVPSHRPSRPQIYGHSASFVMSFLRLISTSELDIQSVWAIVMLSQRHLGSPIHRYTDHIGTRYGKSENDVIMSCLGWYLLQTSSYIYIRHTKCLSHWSTFQGHMGAPLYSYTGQIGPRVGSSGYYYNVDGSDGIISSSSSA